MPQKEKTVEPITLTSEEPEVYELNYIVNFNNCTFNEKVTINQTGKPSGGDPPPPPGT